MATLDIELPNGCIVSATIQDGQQHIHMQLLECQCGCKSWFQPTTPNQKFLNDDHLVNYHSKRRPRKTQRKKTS